MADTIAIAYGSPPWEPTGDAIVTETFDLYDIPLAGIIRQAGADYLFQCLAGQGTAQNLWAYTRVTPVEVDYLKGVSGPDFDRALSDVAESRPLILALVKKEQGIVAAVLVHDPSDKNGLIAALDSFLEGMAADLSSLRAAG